MFPVTVYMLRHIFCHLAPPCPLRLSYPFYCDIAQAQKYSVSSIKVVYQFYIWLQSDRHIYIYTRTIYIHMITISLLCKLLYRRNSFNATLKCLLLVYKYLFLRGHCYVVLFEQSKFFPKQEQTPTSIKHGMPKFPYNEFLHNGVPNLTFYSDITFEYVMIEMTCLVHFLGTKKLETFKDINNNVALRTS